MYVPSTFIIDGIDRLGKSTLIKNIIENVGYYQVVAYGKPPALARYDATDKLRDEDLILENATDANIQQGQYLHDLYRNAFDMLKSQTVDGRNPKFIFDRLHLSEMVYSPLYRNIQLNSLWSLENGINCFNVRLVLLTEDFEISNHFVSDGDSFDDDRRKEEQAMFVNAFCTSRIYDKRIVCVTAPDGSFKDPMQILQEVMKPVL